MPSTPTVLAIDLGTSSARAALFDEAGIMVPESLAAIRHHPRTTDDGGAEMDPDTLLQRVYTVVDESLKAAHGAKLRAVAMSTYWHSLMGVNSEGSPATPVYIWADTRASATIPHLKELLDTTDMYRRTGCPPHPSYFPAKILWLREKHPDIYRRVHRWVSVGEYLQWRLTGQLVCGEAMASATGIYNQRDQEWDHDTLQAIGCQPDDFAPLWDTLKPIGQATPRLAARWPAIAGAAWFAAVGDGACSNIGSGAASPGVEAINYGTSAALRMVVESPVEFPTGLWLYRIDGRRLLLGGALSNGGNIYEWLLNVLQVSPREAEKTLHDLVPGKTGLRFIPHLAGERSPSWSPDATGSIFGLRLDSTPEEIFAAGIEGVLIDFMQVHNMLSQCCENLNKIVASGGAISQSAALAQNLADALGHQLHLSEYREPSTRGAALLALEAIGALHNADLAPHQHSEILYPDPERHRAYQRLAAARLPARNVRQ